MDGYPTLILAGFEFKVREDRFSVHQKDGTHVILDPQESRLLRAFIGAAVLPERGEVAR